MLAAHQGQAPAGPMACGLSVPSGHPPAPGMPALAVAGGSRGRVQGPRPRGGSGLGSNKPGGRASEGVGLGRQRFGAEAGAGGTRLLVTWALPGREHSCGLTAGFRAGSRFGSHTPGGETGPSRPAAVMHLRADSASKREPLPPFQDLKEGCRLAPWVSG